MFGYGQEILLILVLAFLVFGPSEFPKVAKIIAKGLGDLRRMGEEVRSTVESNLSLPDLDREQVAADGLRVSSLSAPAGASSVPDTLPKFLSDAPLASRSQDPGTERVPSLAAPDATTGAYWAQRGSRLFHRRECIWAARIADSERLSFETMDQARHQGRMGCPVCES